MSKPKLRIIPLGGLGEIGKNMTVFELGEDAIIIDAGIMFPTHDMYGVDYIIPDWRYLLDRKDLKLHGLLFTHGHEDHIGAVEHLAEALPNIPMYGTPLTAALVEGKLRDVHLFKEGQIHSFKAGDRLNLGPFKIEAFQMTHSIPDCVGFAIETPHGLIIHSGDYKFDNTPIDGRKPDYARLASYGKRGVKLLMADSTNADKEGWTPSEITIEPAIDRIFKEAKGRVMVATFASLISRIQLVANTAQRYGRKLVIIGTTMREYTRIARKIGYLDIPESVILDSGKMSGLEPHKIALMVTGSQGEPSAVLSKIAQGRHRSLDVQKGDTIIMSSHPIPGNEETVYRTINKLIERGAHVLYDPLERVHVSGHACRDEMRLLIHLVQPEYVLPIHGEMRHLIQHGRLAVASGIPEEKVIVSENGTVIELDRQGIRKAERVPGGYVFVDGSGVGDIGKVVIRDREILARDGFFVVSVNLEKKTGRLLGDPEIISRGFVYLREADELMQLVKANVLEVIGDYYSRSNGNGRLRDRIEESMGRLLFNETKRRPMVFGIVNEF